MLAKTVAPLTEIECNLNPEIGQVSYRTSVYPINGFSCIWMEQPLLAVAPDKVTIEGPTEAKAGDDLSFKCVTGNSNPAAGIQWLVDGNQVDANFTHSVRRRLALSRYSRIVIWDS